MAAHAAHSAHAAHAAHSAHAAEEAAEHAIEEVIAGRLAAILQACSNRERKRCAHESRVHSSDVRTQMTIVALTFYTVTIVCRTLLWVRQNFIGERNLFEFVACVRVFVGMKFLSKLPIILCHHYTARKNEI